VERTSNRVTRAPRTGRAVMRASVLCALASGLAMTTTAAEAAQAPHSTRAVVVKISARRGGFRNVLTNTVGVGATLYTASSCSGACLQSWPRLLMPKGKTIPLGPRGLTGLGTVKVGTRLQVTYRHHRLYTFTGDSGASVNGNGLAGFTVIHNV